MVLKLLRNGLGFIIVAGDYLTRFGKKNRTEDEQRRVVEETQHMTLYHFFACPFCVKTRRAMYKLNLPIGKKSAANGSEYRQELAQGGGRIQVPCLRVSHADGEDQWIYDSKAIISFLQEKFN